jgi:hypothetical protein
MPHEQPVQPIAPHVRRPWEEVSDLLDTGRAVDAYMAMKLARAHARIDNTHPLAKDSPWYVVYLRLAPIVDELEKQPVVWLRSTLGCILRLRRAGWLA